MPLGIQITILDTQMEQVDLNWIKFFGNSDTKFLVRKFDKYNNYNKRSAEAKVRKVIRRMSPHHILMWNEIFYFSSFKLLSEKDEVKEISLVDDCHESSSGCDNSQDYNIFTRFEKF